MAAFSIIGNYAQPIDASARGRRLKDARRLRLSWALGAVGAFGSIDRFAPCNPMTLSPRRRTLVAFATLLTPDKRCVSEVGNVGHLGLRSRHAEGQSPQEDVVRHAVERMDG